MNIDRTSKDLNLLRIFLVISEELNLSRASERLGLSQPALSHALQRLRDEFDDPLFVRASRGLTPTARVPELLPKIRELLTLSESLYERVDGRSFLNLQRSFTLGSTNYFEIRVIDSMLTRLAAEAPGVSLETRSLQGEFPKEDLERGVLDVAVAAYFSDVPESFRIRHLGRDPFVCLARRGHPYLKSRRTLKDYLEARHIKINIPPGALSHIDRHLQEKGQKRTIVSHLGNFLSAPQVLASNDVLLTCPESLAKSYARMFPLVVHELPVKLSPIEIRMIWHERNHRDPFQKWMRDLIADAAKG
ncbi:MAG: LysR family transcriptional regulator [Methylotenera sp.]|nr:LysR family transcriptional regulator [Oligoflexia bacterium]